MIKINDDLLAKLNLRDLPGEHRAILLKAMYEELEMRVGTVIANKMSSHQLDEFEACIKAGDERSSLAWLERNFPDYQVTVREEFEKLCAELATVRNGINALSTLYDFDSRSDAT
jgi:hypothetical protein